MVANRHRSTANRHSMVSPHTVGNHRASHPARPAAMGNHRKASPRRSMVVSIRRSPPMEAGTASRRKVATHHKAGRDKGKATAVSTRRNRRVAHRVAPIRAAGSRGTTRAGRNRRDSYCPRSDHQEAGKPGLLMLFHTFALTERLLGYGPAWPQTQPEVDAVHADTPEMLYAAKLTQTQLFVAIPLCVYPVPPAATVLTLVPLLTAMSEYGSLSVHANETEVAVCPMTWMVVGAFGTARPQTQLEKAEA